MKIPMRLALLLVAGSLAACVSKPARFYTLSPVAGTATVAPQQARPVVVSVQPVEIPDYLDRPQIVTREGSNELKVDEFNRWGGSLAESMSSVLAEDLARQLGSEHVYSNAAPAFEKPQYLVAMRVVRLDAVPGSHVLFKAQWKVTSSADKKSVSRLAQITERVDGKGYEQMVAAMDRALEQVSRQIATEIQAVPPAPAAPASPVPGSVSP